MTKEEIDNLESYLKSTLPEIKIEPTIPITTFGSVDLDDLMDSIKQFKKVPTSAELLRENKSLRSQLKEKDKVINEIYDKINDLYYGNFFSNEKPIKFSYTEIGKELLEILERGKNGK